MNRVSLFNFFFVFTVSIILTGCGGSNDSGNSAGPPSKKLVFAAIGTGGLTGVYYPTGGAIAEMVNKKQDVYNLKLKVESTGGSTYNVNAVLRGDLDFGIAQSDIQYNASNGFGDWQDKPQSELRSVFSIHPELVTLLAADDANITTLADLKGKSVNIGNPGSGNRRNAIDALSTANITWDRDIKAEQVKAAEAPVLLQDQRIDAFFYTVGHPNGAIKEATAGARKVHFVAVTGIDALLEKFPYYVAAEVPISNYPKATNATAPMTFGVKATLITSTKVPDDVVYAVTKEVFENFEKFKALHPAYAVLTKAQMLQGLSAPLHAGAMKYFREAGLLDSN
jgi:TRAP transporter TAXI family solute receptor